MRRLIKSLAAAATTSHLQPALPYWPTQYGMFSTKSSKNSDRHPPKLLQRQQVHIEKFAILNHAIQTHIGQKPTPELYLKMVEWFKQYTHVEHIECLKNPRSLELAAEATFWSVKLGLAPHVAQMDYATFQTFDPIKARLSKRTTIGKLIDQVYSKLQRPLLADDYKFALQEAARASYYHPRPYEEVHTDTVCSSPTRPW